MADMSVIIVKKICEKCKRNYSVSDNFCGICGTKLLTEQELKAKQEDEAALVALNILNFPGLF